MHCNCEVRGSLALVPEITGSLAAGAGISGQVNIAQSEPWPVYEGSYTATPSPEAQSLPTAGRRMEQDVTVEKIPVYITENTAHGNTVYIGGNL